MTIPMISMRLEVIHLYKPLTMLVVNPLKDHQIADLKKVVPDLNLIICKTQQEAIPYMPEVDILVPWGNMNLEQFLQDAPHLKWVHALSAGVENLLVPEFINSPIPLTNAQGVFARPIAEHVMMMILALAHRLPEMLENQAHRKWDRLLLEDIGDKTIGIVGLGGIGSEIAKRAKAFNMKVVGSKRRPSSVPFVDHVYASDELDSLLTEADFVVVALPATPETKGMFTLREFRTMKDTAYFINIARGNLVNESDLVDALQAKLIKGAALDVFSTEPLPDISPLWSMKNVIISPHNAPITPRYLDLTINFLAKNLARFVNQEPLLHVVDKHTGY